MTKIALLGDTHYGYSPNTHDLLETLFENLSKEEFDILIHVGDWISHEQNQFEPMFKLMRKYVKQDILGVKGNHDLWNKSKPKSFSAMDKSHKRLMKKYNIHYLQEGCFKKDDVAIYGFDGWYSEAYPPTNDKYFMPQFEKGENINFFLSQRAHESLNKILEESANVSGKRICVTHFPPYTFNPRYIGMCANQSYLTYISDSFEYLIVGHSHQREDWHKKECRIINPGGDYDSPFYKIIEI